MATSWQGSSPDGNSIEVMVRGDGSTTTRAIALDSACFAPFFTNGTNGVLPTQLAETSGSVYFGTQLIAYTLTIGTGSVTVTFASAPPSGVISQLIAIGLLYP